jgi:hypothetical protein
VADKKEETERIHVLVSREDVIAIDNFRFARRMPNRAAAIRELLRLGLAVKLDTDENE